MNAYKEGRPERLMNVLEFIYAQHHSVRLEDFEPMLDRLRLEGKWKLFPLNRTTVMSTLKWAERYKLVKGEMKRPRGLNRRIRYYSLTDEGMTMILEKYHLSDEFRTSDYLQRRPE